MFHVTLVSRGRVMVQSYDMKGETRGSEGSVIQVLGSRNHGSYLILVGSITVYSRYHKPIGVIVGRTHNTSIAYGLLGTLVTGK